MTILASDCRVEMPRHPSDRKADRAPRHPDPHELHRGRADWRLVRGLRCGRPSLRLTGRRYIGCAIDPLLAEKACARIADALPFGGGSEP